MAIEVLADMLVENFGCLREAVARFAQRKTLRRVMATYLLLEFNDDDAAHDLAKALLSGEREALELVSKSFPRGAYRKPTQFCRNGDLHRKKQDGWTRGKKWGWMVCSVCGRPSAEWCSGANWFAALGINLIPESARTPKHDAERTWISSQQWDDLKPLLEENPVD
jgi:hypothetical protein